MTRLQTEYQRLYLPPETGAASAGALDLIGADGRVRALVLALGQPADWATLAPLWRGVQADLGWPAPAIAVNGVDAFELWFSLADPLPRAEATELLVQLQRRYLADLRPERVRAWPGADAAAEPPACPPFAAGPERWAAFITPDLPAVFGDDPALDFEPGADAQADLLVRQRSINVAGLRTAQAVLVAAEEQAAASPSLSSVKAETKDASTSIAGSFQDPRAFLLAVMNDPSAPLALRIEAAKALLPVQSLGG
jgi:hypothetical protein